MLCLLQSGVVLTAQHAVSADCSCRKEVRAKDGSKQCDSAWTHATAPRECKAAISCVKGWLIEDAAMTLSSCQQDWFVLLSAV